MILAILSLMVWGKAQEKNEAILCLTFHEGAWDLVLFDPPTETGEEVAVFMEIQTEGERSPIIRQTEMAPDLILTVGRGDEGNIRILLDGKLPPKEENAVSLLRVESEKAIRVVEASLWTVTADGRAVMHPLAVDAHIPPQSESDSQPESAGLESMIPESTAESNSSESLPEADPNSLPLYMGCRETAVENGVFSVRLLFFCNRETPLPTVLCRGGGQQIRLETERVGGSSVVAYTYRDVGTESTCVFVVEGLDGAVEITYTDGQFVRQTAVPSLYP